MVFVTLNQNGDSFDKEFVDRDELNEYIEEILNDDTIYEFYVDGEKIK